jgi:hypothetical protein
VVEDKARVFDDQGGRALGLSLGMVVVNYTRDCLHAHVENDGLGLRKEVLSVVDKFTADVHEPCSLFMVCAELEPLFFF